MDSVRNLLLANCTYMGSVVDCFESGFVVNITGKDPKTGQRLSDDSTLYNMIIFLVAGHEMTSDGLSFVFYYLLKHPEVLRKAQQEVDDVVGEQAVQQAHLARLP